MKGHGDKVMLGRGTGDGMQAGDAGWWCCGGEVVVVAELLW
jgi:hypothetical protein